MTDATAPSSRHVYRQISPQITGWLFVGLAVLLIVLALTSWGDNPAPKLVAWLVFGGILSWTVLLRPCVVLALDGVTFRNIVRDVHLPWNQVDVVEPRWNLRIYTPEDHGYTAWSISSQAARPRATGGFGIGQWGGLGRMAREASDSDHTRPAKPLKKVTAASVAEDIRKAQEELDEAVAQGTLAAPDGTVTTSWYLPSIALLLAGAVAVLLAMVL